jgi:hypothetical protein
LETLCHNIGSYFSVFEDQLRSDFKIVSHLRIFYYCFNHFY